MIYLRGFAHAPTVFVVGKEVAFSETALVLAHRGDMLSLTLAAGHKSEGVDILQALDVCASGTSGTSGALELPKFWSSSGTEGSAGKYEQ